MNVEQTRNMARKRGDTIKFRRYASLSTATTPLTEGTTPPGQQLSKTDLTAEVKAYGDYIHITDWVDLVVEDPVLTEGAEVLGEQMGETRDKLVRDILVASSSTQNVGGNLAKSDIQTAVTTMMGNDARMISNVVRASTGQGTSPVRPSYWAIAHTDLSDDLEDISGFKHTSEYPTQGDVQEAEWGSIGSTRWLVSSVADSTYKCPVLGQNAYGVTEIPGGGAANIVKAFGSGGTEDPLDQRATSGWKMTFTCRILNDSFILVLTSVTDG